jgi:hypothetical protein
MHHFTYYEASGSHLARLHALFKQFGKALAHVSLLIKGPEGQVVPHSAELVYLDSGGLDDKALSDHNKDLINHLLKRKR